MAEKRACWIDMRAACQFAASNCPKLNTVVGDVKAKRLIKWQKKQHCGQYGPTDFFGFHSQVVARLLICCCPGLFIYLRFYSYTVWENTVKCLILPSILIFVYWLLKGKKHLYSWWNNRKCAPCTVVGRNSATQRGTAQMTSSSSLTCVSESKFTLAFELMGFPSFPLHFASKRVIYFRGYLSTGKKTRTRSSDGIEGSTMVENSFNVL